MSVDTIPDEGELRHQLGQTCSVFASFRCSLCEAAQAYGCSVAELCRLAAEFVAAELRLGLDLP